MCRPRWGKSHINDRHTACIICGHISRWPQRISHHALPVNSSYITLYPCHTTKEQNSWTWTKWMRFLSNCKVSAIEFQQSTARGIYFLETNGMTVGALEFHLEPLCHCAKIQRLRLYATTHVARVVRADSETANDSIFSLWVAMPITLLAGSALLNSFRFPRWTKWEFFSLNIAEMCVCVFAGPHGRTATIKE